MVETAYTVGYEGTDIDRFVATLKSIKIEMLVDVRAIALSRKKGFSKTALKARLEFEGIDYLHLKALGDPKPGRVAARAGRHSEFRKIYRTHLGLLESKEALGTLISLALDKPVCLLCFERDPEFCHRSIVTEKLQKKGINSFHLFADDPTRYVKYASKLPRRYSHQSLAAA
jgi:uncharacterized protein (DUF488 family)